MTEPLTAPAAPPEGEAEAILRRKEVRQPCSGKRGDGPWVLVEPAIYLSVTERDTVLAALASATARVERVERRLARFPDCPGCNGKGGHGVPEFDRDGEWGFEMCEDCGGTGKAVVPIEDLTAAQAEAERLTTQRDAARERERFAVERLTAERENTEHFKAEAERLRGERADLQHKLAHWQRVAEESGTMVARRVEAMREAIAHLSRRVKTPWRKLYAEGYRVVPVVLTEVPAPRGGKGGA